MRKMTRLMSSLATCVALTLIPAASFSQSQFSPVIQVNDQAITGYELKQRKRMLELLRAPGNLNELARTQLIEDRIKLQEARDMGIRASREQILDGMSEFAGRAGLDREQFVKILKSNGVAEETFRDFVRAGVVWREVVRARFAARTQISEAEVDRALGQQGGGSSVRVLLSEIIIPAPPGQENAVRERAQKISELTSTSAFSAQARKYSATATRGNGGRLPWRDLNELPPQLRPILLGLRPGEVTDPLPLQGAVALFQLRKIEEGAYSAPEVAAVEYAAYYMPGGRSAETLAKARVLKGKIDRCDDLYGVAKGQPEQVLERGTKAPQDIPTDIAYELSKLDAGEVSTALTRADGETLVFLMLCGRTTTQAEGADRQQVSIGLRNRRLASQADGYLAQLKSEARITEK